MVAEALIRELASSTAHPGAAASRRQRWLVLSIVLPLAAAPALAGEAAPKSPARSQAHVSRSDASVVYRLRPDVRACEPPACGGFFVSEVNRDTTRCADGSRTQECYVARLEPGDGAAPDSETLQNLASTTADWRAVMRGRLEAPRAKTAGAATTLRVTEAWRPAGEGAGDGSFFSVRDAGIRCVRAPCPSIRALLVNEATELLVSEVDLERAKATPAELEQASDALVGGGLLVVGAPAPGSTSDADVLLGSRLYLRVTPAPLR